MYSIDTSALIDGWVRFYPPTNFPTLWDHLDTLIMSGDLLACELVHAELKLRSDDLLKWVNARPTMFESLDDAVQTVASEILECCPNLVSRSSRIGADPFIISHAKCRNLVVITGEKPRSRINPKIPDVCDLYGVRWMNLTDLIRQQQWRF